MKLKLLVVKLREDAKRIGERCVLYVELRRSIKLLFIGNQLKLSSLLWKMKFM